MNIGEVHMLSDHLRQSYIAIKVPLLRMHVGSYAWYHRYNKIYVPAGHSTLHSLSEYAFKWVEQ